MTAPTVHLRQFLPMVLPHVPGCPEFVAAFNLRMAAIEFCERTRCWRSISTVEIDQDGIALCAPPYAAIHLIEKATFNDGSDEVTLEPIQYSDVNEREFADSAGATPRYITQAQYNTLRILPFRAGTLALSLFLKPVNGSDYQADVDGIIADQFDVVPEFIYTLHAEQVAAGAIARLMSQPGKPWTNLQLAMMWAQRFERNMDQHFSVSLTGQHRARRRTRYNDF